MSNVPLHVGLDYHQQHVQVCVMNQAGQVLVNKKCPNDWQSIARAAEPYGQVIRAGVEACCGSADLAEELVGKAKWPTQLCHPGFTSRMRQSPDKHDHGDAQVIADLARVGYLPKVWLAPREVRELRRMVRYRQQQVDQRRNVKLRITAVLRELRLFSSATRWSKPWLAWLGELELADSTRWVMDQHLAELAWLSERIAAADQKLSAITAKDPIVIKLLEQSGIGPVTAWVLRAEVGRFDRFTTGKQLSCFCGLSPCNASSGERQADLGLIHAGNPMLKSILIEAAHRLARHEPRWREMYQGMLARGGHKNVALAAVANRWMRWLFHQMKQIDQG